MLYIDNLPIKFTSQNIDPQTFLLKKLYIQNMIIISILNKTVNSNVGYLWIIKSRQKYYKDTCRKNTEELQQWLWKLMNRIINLIEKNKKKLRFVFVICFQLVNIFHFKTLEHKQAQEMKAIQQNARWESEAKEVLIQENKR